MHHCDMMETWQLSSSVLFVGKILLYVFWDAQKIILTDYLQKEKSITWAHYLINLFLSCETLLTRNAEES